MVTTIKKMNDNRFSYVKLTGEGDEKRKLSIEYNNDRFSKFLNAELEAPKGRESVENTLDYLKQLNLHFQGEEFINWTYSLPDKLGKELKLTRK